MIESLLGSGSVNRPAPDPRLQALESMMAGSGMGAATGRAMNQYPTRLQQDLQRRVGQGETLEGIDALNLLNQSNPPEYEEGREDDIPGY